MTKIKAITPFSPPFRLRSVLGDVQPGLTSPFPLLTISGAEVNYTFHGRPSVGGVGTNN